MGKHLVNQNDVLSNDNSFLAHFAVFISINAVCCSCWTCLIARIPGKEISSKLCCIEYTGNS